MEIDYVEPEGFQEYFKVEFPFVNHPYRVFPFKRRSEICRACRILERYVIQRPSRKFEEPEMQEDAKREFLKLMGKSFIVKLSELIGEAYYGFPSKSQIKRDLEDLGFQVRFGLINSEEVIICRSKVF